MEHNPSRHHRKSIRLKEWDYAEPGAYFVTLCVHGRECLFGKIVNGGMRLNECGGIVHDEWKRTFQIRPELHIDEFVIMPNHFHAIIFIRDSRRGDPPVAPTKMRPHGPKPFSIGAAMAGFKSVTTKRINQIRNTPGSPVWQRNYYDHICRNGNELNRIREYIRNNPSQWDSDEENPCGKSPRYVAMLNPQQ
jgi:putative transposase